MIQLDLTKGKTAFVDDDFSGPLTGWRVDSRGLYVVRVFWKDNKPKTRLLHRFVMDAPKGVEVDHRNGNKLDNRKSNLRPCTHSQNQRNRTKLNKNNKSGARGVYWSKLEQSWYAQVTINGKAYNVGRGIQDFDEAVRIRDEAAKRMHGEFFAPSICKQAA